MFRLSAFVLLVAFLIQGLACTTHREPADLVLLDGKILTLEPETPQVEALAVKGNTVIALGPSSEIRSYIGPETEVLELNGRLATPGLIESHAHFSGLGESKLNLDLTHARTWSEIVSQVREAATGAAAGQWIVGRGWHQEKWEHPPKGSVEGLPTNVELSNASPDNPVLLVHASGHASIANLKAMDLAGVTAATTDPDGGQIVRDRRGQPIGVFRESAQGLVRKAYSEALAARSRQEVEDSLRQIVHLAAQECLQFGITSFHDAGAGFEFVDFLKKEADEGRLPIRLYVMLGGSNEALAERLPEYRIVGYGDNHLTVRAIKRFADGALGSHGAWLLEPYDDLPSSTGLPTKSMAELGRTAELAAQYGFQLCTHAIGDRANREVLDVYEKAYQGDPNRDWRWRIEHSQHLDPADIPRFGKLGVIAAMQGIHAVSDGAWVPRRLGEQRSREGAYPWRSLLDSGATICNGTDAPVESVDPIACFRASVTRRLADGSDFYPEQAMTREEALRSYTAAGAYASFEEEIKGTLRPGKLADIAVFSGDLMTLPPDQLGQVVADFTIVGGRIAYRRD